MSSKESSFTVQFETDADASQSDDYDVESSFTVQFETDASQSDDYDVPCAPDDNEMGGIYDAKPPQDEQPQESRLNLIQPTHGVSSGRVSTVGTGVGGDVSAQLEVRFGDQFDTCCHRYVNDLCWHPRPWIYPNFVPSRAQVEVEQPNPDGSYPEMVELPGGDDGVPTIFYHARGEDAIDVAYCDPDHGVRISLPTGNIRSMLNQSFSPWVTFEPPLNGICKPASGVFLIGPMCNGGITDDRYDPPKTVQEPATIPVDFILRIHGGDDATLSKIEFKPETAGDSQGVIRVHKPPSIDEDGEYPERESNFNDALVINGNNAELIAALKENLNENGRLPSGDIVMRVFPTYGRFEFELGGKCPKCERNDDGGQDCSGTETVTARQGYSFYRQPDQILMGDPIAEIVVARLENITTDAPDTDSEYLDGSWWLDTHVTGQGHEVADALRLDSELSLTARNTSTKQNDSCLALRKESGGHRYWIAPADGSLVIRVSRGAHTSYSCYGSDGSFESSHEDGHVYASMGEVVTKDGPSGNVNLGDTVDNIIYDWTRDYSLFSDGSSSNDSYSNINNDQLTVKKGHIYIFTFKIDAMSASIEWVFTPYDEDDEDDEGDEE